MIPWSPTRELLPVILDIRARRRREHWAGDSRTLTAVLCDPCNAAYLMQVYLSSLGVGSRQGPLPVLLRLGTVTTYTYSFTPS